MALLRVVSTASGSFKCNFDDNCVISVDIHARCCVVSLPPRSSCAASPFSRASLPPRRTQLLDYLTHDVAERLIPVLEEVINPTRDEPIVCRPLIEARRRVAGSIFTAGYEIRAALWSADAEVAASAGLVEFLPDGAVAVDSEDSSANLQLSADGLRASVTYPLLVGQDPETLRFQHLWSTRRFSPDVCPPRWARALALAQKLQLERSLALTTLSEMASGAAPLSDAPPPRLPQPDPTAMARLAELSESLRSLPLSSEYPRQASVSGRASQVVRCPAPRRDGPLAADPTGARDTWWTDTSHMLFPSVDGGDPLSLEWTPEALFEYRTDSREAEAVFHRGGHILRTAQGGGFVRLWTATTLDPLGPRGSTTPAMPFGGQLPSLLGLPSLSHALGPTSRVFAAAAVPATVSLVLGAEGHPATGHGPRLRIGPVAAHLCAFRSAAESGWAELQVRDGLSGSTCLESEECPCTPTPEPAAPSIPVGVRHVVNCPEGTFRAFHDGAVTVSFSDRTILTWNRPADPNRIRIVLPSGIVRHASAHEGSASLMDPEARPYLLAAMQFASWAFTTPEERASEIRRRAAVDLEVSRTVRGAAMCELEAGGRPLTVLNFAREFMVPPTMHGTDDAAGSVSEATSKSLSGLSYSFYRSMQPSSSAPAYSMPAMNPSDFAQGLSVYPETQLPTGLLSQPVAPGPAWEISIHGALTSVSPGMADVSMHARFCGVIDALLARNNNMIEQLSLPD